MESRSSPDWMTSEAGVRLFRAARQRLFRIADEGYASYSEPATPGDSNDATSTSAAVATGRAKATSKGKRAGAARGNGKSGRPAAASKRRRGTAGPLAGLSDAGEDSGGEGVVAVDSDDGDDDDDDTDVGDRGGSSRISKAAAAATVVASQVHRSLHSLVVYDRIGTGGGGNSGGAGGAGRGSDRGSDLAGGTGLKAVRLEVVLEPSPKWEALAAVVDEVTEAWEAMHRTRGGAGIGGGGGRLVHPSPSPQTASSSCSPWHPAQEPGASGAALLIAVKDDRSAAQVRDVLTSLHRRKYAPLQLEERDARATRGEPVLPWAAAGGVSSAMLRQAFARYLRTQAARTRALREALLKGRHLVSLPPHGRTFLETARSLPSDERDLLVAAEIPGWPDAPPGAPLSSTAAAVSFASTWAPGATSAAGSAGEGGSGPSAEALAAAAALPGGSSDALGLAQASADLNADIPAPVQQQVEEEGGAGDREVEGVGEVAAAGTASSAKSGRPASRAAAKASAKALSAPSAAAGTVRPFVLHEVRLLWKALALQLAEDRRQSAAYHARLAAFYRQAGVVARAPGPTNSGADGGDDDGGVIDLVDEEGGDDDAIGPGITAGSMDSDAGHSGAANARDGNTRAGTHQRNGALEDGEDGVAGGEGGGDDDGGAPLPTTEGDIDEMAYGLLGRDRARAMRAFGEKRGILQAGGSPARGRATTSGGGGAGTLSRSGSGRGAAEAAGNEQGSAERVGLGGVAGGGSGAGGAALAFPSPGEHGLTPGATQRLSRRAGRRDGGALGDDVGDEDDDGIDAAVAVGVDLQGALAGVVDGGDEVVVLDDAGDDELEDGHEDEDGDFDDFELEEEAAGEGAAGAAPLRTGAGLSSDAALLARTVSLDESMNVQHNPFAAAAQAHLRRTRWVGGRGGSRGARGLRKPRERSRGRGKDDAVADVVARLYRGSAAVLKSGKAKPRAQQAAAGAAAAAAAAGGSSAGAVGSSAGAPADAASALAPAPIPGGTTASAGGITLVPRGLTTVVYPLSRMDARGSLLADLRPTFVIMFDPDPTLTREIEVWRASQLAAATAAAAAVPSRGPASSLPPAPVLPPLRLYILTYVNSSEEQKFLSAVKREQQAFEKLIATKGHMAPPSATAGSGPDGGAEGVTGAMVIRKGAKDAWGITFNDSKADVVAQMASSGGTAGALTALTAGAADALMTGSYRPNPLARLRPLAMDIDAPDRGMRRVIVDQRELRAKLPMRLYTGGLEIVPLTLEVGDFILSPELCVERKSLPDLIGSLSGGRLYTQAEAMTRAYKSPLLAIEFDEGKPFALQPGLEVPAELEVHHTLSKLVLLLLHFPSLRVLWARSPGATATYFAALKQLPGQEEPDAAVAASVGSDGTVLVRPGAGSTAAGTAGGSGAAASSDDAGAESGALVDGAPGASASTAAAPDAAAGVSAAAAEAAENNPSALAILSSLPGVTAGNMRALRSRLSCLADLAHISEADLAGAIGPGNAAVLHHFLHARNSGAL